MRTLTKIPIRLELGIASNPPVYPLDLNTAAGPKIFRGTGVAFDIGIFDRQGNCVDLSNLDFLEVDILPIPVSNQNPATNYQFGPYSYWPFPTVPPAPILWSTVAVGDITGLISRQNWLNQTQQQARIAFDWTDTQSLDLGGQMKRDFWLVVQGLAGTQRMVYGATRLAVYESGAMGIFLPSCITPIVVPEATTLYVQPNQQMLFNETITIEGEVVVDGMLIQV